MMKIILFFILFFGLWQNLAFAKPETADQIECGINKDVFKAAAPFEESQQYNEEGMDLLNETGLLEYLDEEQADFLRKNFNLLTSHHFFPGLYVWRLFYEWASTPAPPPYSSLWFSGTPFDWWVYVVAHIFPPFIWDDIFEAVWQMRENVWQMREDTAALMQYNERWGEERECQEQREAEEAIRQQWQEAIRRKRRATEEAGPAEQTIRKSADSLEFNKDFNDYLLKIRAMSDAFYKFEGGFEGGIRTMNNAHHRFEGGEDSINQAL